MVSPRTDMPTSIAESAVLRLSGAETLRIDGTCTSEEGLARRRKGSPA